MGPIEIIAGPLELYWAPVGTAMPAIGVAPETPWTLIGKSGSSNYTDDGVAVTFDETLEDFVPLGQTLPIKSFRTAEGLLVSVTVADLSLDTVRLALNQNAVTTGTGDKSVSLYRGVNVAEMALLARGVGKSPELEGGNLQFEIFRARVAGTHELSFVKGAPAGVLLEFSAMFDTDKNDVGVLRVAATTVP